MSPQQANTIIIKGGGMGVGGNHITTLVIKHIAQGRGNLSELSEGFYPISSCQSWLPFSSPFLFPNSIHIYILCIKFQLLKFSCPIWYLLQSVHSLLYDKLLHFKEWKIRELLLYILISTFWIQCPNTEPVSSTLLKTFQSLMFNGKKRFCTSFFLCKNIFTCFPLS